MQSKVWEEFNKFKENSQKIELEDLIELVERQYKKRSFKIYISRDLIEALYDIGVNKGFSGVGIQEFMRNCLIDYAKSLKDRNE